jgi:hypothetical protein
MEGAAWRGNSPAPSTISIKGANFWEPSLKVMTLNYELR